MSSFNKSLAKKMKSKGLQRLRWYCQMCEKQCRDENGFKNHCTTENHLRNMEKFSDRSRFYVENFSRDFERSFLDVLSHHHHTKRVNANFVYNELIQDKTHIHMNSTRWDSLASFVKYLGETGRCVVDETERGWFVQWIDPEEKKKEVEKRIRREKEVRTSDRRTRDMLKRQEEVEEEEEEEEEDSSVGENLVTDEKVIIVSNTQPKPSVVSSVFNTEKEEQLSDTVSLTTLEIKNGSDKTWLLPEIVVKIISSKVGDGLKGEKAVVVGVHDDEADLVLLNSGQEISNVPSKRLETVIPKTGKVKILTPDNHFLRGKTGNVLEIGENSVKVKLENGEALDFKYEDISRMFEED